MGKSSLPRARSEADRFWEKVDAEGDCWVWMAAIHPSGYGLFRSKSQGRAHRWAWEYLVGPIPQGMTIDHRCLVKRCVNVAHLEVVSVSENSRRAHTSRTRREKSHCPRGHEYTEENTYRNQGGRYCRKCGIRATLAWYHARRAKDTPLI